MLTVRLEGLTPTPTPPRVSLTVKYPPLTSFLNNYVKCYFPANVHRSGETFPKAYGCALKQVV